MKLFDKKFYFPNIHIFLFLIAVDADLLQFIKHIVNLKWQQEAVDQDFIK